MKLNIKNLNKSYNNEAILKDINISIENVKTIGIIGESGSGKSTLLRQLAGIETPETGEICINDLSPILDNYDFKNNIGYVFQKHNLFPHLSIEKNITLILEKIKKLPKDEVSTKVNKVLYDLKIENERDKLPNQVSGGQAQRASIARALATDAKLIFLDEPTAALDPILTDEVLKAVTSLKDNGIEFIFVTHELEFLKDFADYIIFLREGKIIEHGPKSCLNNPISKELKEFLNVRNQKATE